MNRIQFFVLIGLSSLVIVLLGLNLYLSRKVSIQQLQASQLQQALTQGKDIQQKLTLLARRINADAQKTPPNQALKDILTRQQINIKNPDASANATDSSGAAAPAPAPNGAAPDSPAKKTEVDEAIDNALDSGLRTADLGGEATTEEAVKFAEIEGEILNRDSVR